MDGSNALEQQQRTQPEENIESIGKGVQALENLLVQLDQISRAPVPPTPGEEKPTTS